MFDFVTSLFIFTFFFLLQKLKNQLQLFTKKEHPVETLTQERKTEDISLGFVKPTVCNAHQTECNANCKCYCRVSSCFDAFVSTGSRK